MTLARYWTVTTISVMPWILSSSMIWAITWRSTIGTMGLGRLIVRGRRREPSPPAITTAFTAWLLSFADGGLFRVKRSIARRMWAEQDDILGQGCSNV